MIADFNSTKAGGAESMITIPLVDWLAKVGETFRTDPLSIGTAPVELHRHQPVNGSYTFEVTSTPSRIQP